MGAFSASTSRRRPAIDCVVTDFLCFRFQSRALLLLSASVEHSRTGSPRVYFGLTLYTVTEDISDDQLLPLLLWTSTFLIRSLLSAHASHVCIFHVNSTFSDAVTDDAFISFPPFLFVLLFVRVFTLGSPGTQQRSQRRFLSFHFTFSFSFSVISRALEQTILSSRTWFIFR